jgi:hypothetical protein
MEVTEKKLQVKNLERITEQKCRSYDEAKLVQQVGPKDGKVKNFDECDKIKIFARYDGTFDVVWYRKIQKEPKSVIKIDVGSLEPTAETKKFIEGVKKNLHGQKAKDRNKSHRKPKE